MADDVAQVQASTGRADPLADAGKLLYTPAQAAELLAVRESWIRRKAAARAIPCTFLGKHLRFTHADLLAIIAAALRPATSGRRPAQRPRRRR